MKTKLMLFLLLGTLVSAGPKIFSGGKQLHDAMGDDQASAVYEFKGPYALRWTLRDVKPSRSADSLAEYWKPHTANDPPWVSVYVKDARTRETVANEMVTAWEGTLQVKEGGRHYLVVSGEKNVAWTIWGMEGVMTDSSTGIKKAPPSETAEEAAAVVMEDLRGKYTGAALDERKAGVSLIQSRSSSAQDFNQRWQSYSRAMGW